MKTFRPLKGGGGEEGKLFSCLEGEQKVLD